MAFEADLPTDGRLRRSRSDYLCMNAELSLHHPHFQPFA